MQIYPIHTNTACFLVHLILSYGIAKLIVNSWEAAWMTEQINVINNGSCGFRIGHLGRTSAIDGTWSTPRHHHRWGTTTQTTAYIGNNVRLTIKRHIPQVECSQPTYPTIPPTQEVHAPSRWSQTCSRTYPCLPTTLCLPLLVGWHHSVQHGAGG